MNCNKNCTESEECADRHEKHTEECSECGENEGSRESAEHCGIFGKLREECGVFGIYTNEISNVSASTYFGLYALQHRGQESCGIVVNDGGVFNYKKGLGLVNEVYDKETLSALNHGKIAVGHVRYSTTGTLNSHNTQPLVVRHIKGHMAISHNGNLVNAAQLREEYEMKGAIFHSTSDTEVISHAIVEQRVRTSSIEEAVKAAMYKIKGAYSLVIMSPKKLIAVRDPNGFRPLCIGRLPDNAGYAAASETCALDSIGADFIRNVLPGEIIVIDDNGVKSITEHCGGKGSLCVFEYIYFARPDSVIENASVHNARIRAGMFLAKNDNVSADVVVGVPDSGIDAAIGYSKQSGIPYGIGLIKNRYVGRTFIQPQQDMRENSVRIKLNPVSDVIKNKRVIIIDDSIVRGTTTKILVNLLRDSGAKEVHVRISSPPFKHPCYFGTDIDNRNVLIAHRLNSVEEIAEAISADSLGYLSIEDAKKIAENASCDFCTGCFSGIYPIDIPKDVRKDKFENKIGSY
jgi:amidophosphoribosyltransferase